MIKDFTISVDIKFDRTIIGLSETRRDTRGMLKSIEDEQLYNDNLIRG